MYKLTEEKSDDNAVSEHKVEAKKEHKTKSIAKKIWHFLWEEESLASYVVFIIIAFILLRFVAFPVFLFATGYSDIAAVVSPSMVHNELTNHTFYKWLQFNNISSEGWPFQNGLNIGDVIFVKKVPVTEIKVGDIILFYSKQGQIIHRVVQIKVDSNCSAYNVGVNVQGSSDTLNANVEIRNTKCYLFTTKGDANPVSMDIEKNLPYDQIKGKLVSKVPYLGYPKVALNYIISF